MFILYKIDKDSYWNKKKLYLNFKCCQKKKEKTIQ